MPWRAEPPSLVRAAVPWRAELPYCVAQPCRTSPGLQEARKGLSAGLPGLFPLPIPRGSPPHIPIPAVLCLGSQTGSGAEQGWAAARAALLPLTILGNAAAPDLAGLCRAAAAAPGYQGQGELSPALPGPQQARGQGTLLPL